MKFSITISQKVMLLFGVTLTCLIVSSCVDDTTTEINVPSTSLVQVIDKAPEVFEDESTSVDVSFIEPALGDGTIEVKFSRDAVYGTDFTTNPEGSVNGASIPVAKGAESASITFNPVTKLGTIETSKVDLDFSASGGMSFGTKRTTSVTILNRPEIKTIGSVADFGSVQELETSTSQSFEVTGLGLTGNLEISASDNFQVSLDDSDFEDDLEIAFADVNTDTQMIYVRFAPIFDVLGAQQGNITLESENAHDVSVSVSGTGTESPSTFSTDVSDLDFGNVATDAVSEAEAIVVSGLRLTENVVASTTAPFEVSSDGISFSASISLDYTLINPEDGEVEFFVRFAPTSGVIGDKTGTVMLSTAGAGNQQVSLAGLEE